MLDKVLIARQDDKIYTFAYVNDKLTYVLEDKVGIFGEAVFRARVVRTNHANRTAFIEYLPGEYGYVNIPDGLSIQDGSLIPVQLMWLGDGQKQAKFRYGWQLVGKYVVYAAVSPVRIRGHKLAKSMHEQLQQLAGTYPGLWVVRSCVRTNEDIPLVAEEMKVLSTKANILEQAYSTGQCDVGVPNYLKLLRSLPVSPGCEVICKEHDINQGLLIKQDLWQIDAITLDFRLVINDLLENYFSLLASSQVELANGAKLEINTVSGITIIDVNSDRLNISGNSLNFLVLDVIYEQICLRNLQGIILLDLVKNMSKSDEDKILAYLEKKFKADITHCKILGFTRAGLCEIIRTKFS